MPENIAWIDTFAHGQAAFVRVEGNLIQRLNERNVEAIDPNHILVAFVRVLVPAALRRQDEIAVFHHHLLPIDVGVSAVSLEDETKCRHGVPMRRRDFARLDQLKRKKNRVAGHLAFGHARIDQTNDAPLDAAAGD